VYEDSALHALFIWYLRVRCNLTYQYLRIYQPGDFGLPAQLWTQYGASLTGFHLLQANPLL
jgi:hypothetical protein